MNLNADRLGAHYKDAQVVYFYLKSENISKNGGKRNANSNRYNRFINCNISFMY